MTYWTGKTELEIVEELSEYEGLISSEEELHEQFAADSGIEYSAVFVPQSQSRNADEDRLSLNWIVTLKKGSTEIKTDYMQGIGHLPNYKFGRKTQAEAEKERIAAEKGHYRAKKLKPPTLVDVLCSLVLDSSVINYASFDDWANEYGCDTDSREAEKMYNACMITALQLRQMIDLDAAKDAFSDW